MSVKLAATSITVQYMVSGTFWSPRFAGSVDQRLHIDVTTCSKRMLAIAMGTVTALFVWPWLLNSK